MKTVLTTLTAAGMLVVAAGCQPPAKPDVSTDITVEETTTTSDSNTTMAVETPSSNTTAAAETPAGETP
ncbi:hypothetical protein Poly41_10200 [Novipirellula artificiosorum]|uniref:Uncharacterized protein n=2 Tax=Novipirellula artificiosorum TaxID=2528016 RepID=A0A5C6E1F5_9BACT|nr:hypothetical protein Poly41_10200 [Novipirellula artificiosorum]